MNEKKARKMANKAARRGVEWKSRTIRRLRETEAWQWTMQFGIQVRDRGLCNPKPGCDAAHRNKNKWDSRGWVAAHMREGSLI